MKEKDLEKMRATSEEKFLEHGFEKSTDAFVPSSLICFHKDNYAEYIEFDLDNKTVYHHNSYELPLPSTMVAAIYSFSVGLGWYGVLK